MRTLIAALLVLSLATAGRGEGLDEQPVKLPAYEAIPRIEWYAARECIGSA